MRYMLYNGGNPISQISVGFSAAGYGKNAISTDFHRLFGQIKNPSTEGVYRQ